MENDIKHYQKLNEINKRTRDFVDMTNQHFRRSKSAEL